MSFHPHGPSRLLLQNGDFGDIFPELLPGTVEGQEVDWEVVEARIRHWRSKCEWRRAVGALRIQSISVRGSSPSGSIQRLLGLRTRLYGDDGTTLLA